VVIRRVNPVFSREVQAEMRTANGKVSVSVLVSIDPSGTVQSVRVVSSSGEPNHSGPYIRLAALNAARQWKFRPGTAGGKPVASQTTLVFTF
jgi:protein TonB